MVFEGNLDLDVQVALRTSHLFCPFPARVANERAFLDRFHSYLPGWEMPRFAVPTDRSHTIPYGVAITIGSIISTAIFRA